jgi:23S rRNA pseudouridine2605 synthase
MKGWNQVRPIPVRVHVKAMSEKLQKVLARSGYGSRREIEGWIEAGRVVVNGGVAQLGERVTLEDHVQIDGEKARLKRGPVRRRVVLYHKPEGQICTKSDPGGRVTVFQALPVLTEGRWVTVGRLDINTSGLLLLTNDGELAHKLMHPSTGVIREYAVRVLGRVDPPMIRRLQRGVRLKDGLAAFEEIEDGGGRGANHWYRVKIREGRNRAVRRIWESQGVKVSRLIRIKYGPIVLSRLLKLGQWKELKGRDLELLERYMEPSDEPAVKKSPAWSAAKQPLKPKRPKSVKTRRNAPSLSASGLKPRRGAGRSTKPGGKKRARKSVRAGRTHG